MFKYLLFAAFLAFAAAKPLVYDYPFAAYSAPVAYSAYSSPVAAYSAYSAPVAYSAYSYPYASPYASPYAYYLRK